MTRLHDETIPLRDVMVEQLRSLGGVRSEPVAAAFRAVPRHTFAPDAPLTQVYDATTTVWPKHDGAGRMTSTVSAAHIQAVQLEQADVRWGMRVLEIGSGGYNAALLASLVGAEGEVTTVDIDPEIVDRARSCLDVAGFGRVRTLVADGDTGVPEHGPYDRIVVTARSWDIPPGWIAQLAPGGRIVVPLRLGTMTRSVALDRTHGLGEGEGVLLSGGDARLCSFVPMQGAGAQEDKIGLLPDMASAGEDGPGRVQLRADAHTGDDDLTRLMSAIGAAITGPARHRPVTRWTGVEFDHVDDLDLWLGLRLPAAGILTADREITDLGRPTSVTRAGAPTLVTDGGFAYRTKRPIPETDTFETGVLAWGRDAADLADHYARTVAEWGRYRAAGGRGPRLTVVAARTPIEPDPRHRVLEKNHTRIVVSWPTAQVSAHP
ncbi:methyltransferase, FxLD system [Pseudonocardia hydrocarbonoxydans]|uniref:methyltransferase, FxLD system n=1 Tax=Pseudonocardia hydrocarbonoxydans TaxID=76726 RepID=UPI0031E3B95B